MSKPCRNPGSNCLCFACQMGKYMDEQSNMTMCKRCTVCDPETEVEEGVCDGENNQQCVCREGFYMKGNECVMESTTGSETVPPSIKSPRWWFWVLLIVTILTILFILFFVKRWFCLQVCSWFDINRRSSKRDVNKNDEELDRHAEDVKINLNEHFL